VCVCQLDQSSRWPRRLIPRRWVRFVEFTLRNLGSKPTRLSGSDLLLTHHDLRQHFRDFRASVFRQYVHKFIGCLGLLLGWLRFAKSASESLGHSIGEWSFLLPTANAVLTFTAEIGSFGRNRPAEPKVGSFGQISIRGLNDALGAQREQGYEVMSLRCKVPRSLFRAYFGEYHRSFVHRGCINFHRIQCRCPAMNANTGTIPRCGITGKFGMRNWTGGKNSAIGACIRRGSLLGLS
jgi:hypothetical protein